MLFVLRQETNPLPLIAAPPPVVLSWRKASRSYPEMQGSLSPGRQRQWQTCCHAVAGGGAKLGPLFTVCLFLSYWDLTGRVGQGQLVIRKLWMPGIPARSVTPEGARRSQLCLSHADEEFPSESRLWQCYWCLLVESLSIAEWFMPFRGQRVLVTYTYMYAQDEKRLDCILSVLY